MFFLEIRRVPGSGMEVEAAKVGELKMNDTEWKVLKCGKNCSSR